MRVALATTAFTIAALAATALAATALADAALANTASIRRKKRGGRHLLSRLELRSLRRTIWRLVCSRRQHVRQWWPSWWRHVVQNIRRRCSTSNVRRRSRNVVGVHDLAIGSARGAENPTSRTPTRRGAMCLLAHSRLAHVIEISSN